MDNFILYIKKNKIPCHFISPHFDDAILSAGALMVELSDSVPVQVVNVFTEASDSKPSLSITSLLKKTGYASSKELFRDREKEDKKVLSPLARKITNLGFTDALWRKKDAHGYFSQQFAQFIPELKYTYPTYYHIISGIISKNDKDVIIKIEKKLSKIPKNDFVFCPLGVGRHVDHKIVHAACKKLFPNVIFWEDFPYSMRKHALSFNKNKKYYVYQKNLKQKIRFIKGYKTQVQGLFNGTIPEMPEKYVFSEEIDYAINY